VSWLNAFSPAQECVASSGTETPWTGQASASIGWRKLVAALSELKQDMSINHVAVEVQKYLIGQLFGHFNAVMLNLLLSKKNLTTFNTGQRIYNGLLPVRPLPNASSILCASK
jgi:hypothetical protein